MGVADEEVRNHRIALYGVEQDLRGLGDDYDKRGELIRDKLYALAGDPHNPAISPIRERFD
ncbi:MAG: hypothetical protein ABSA50_05775 [Candidatus Bathyarchaeia archaeon]|jgi:hypothetical protein